MLRVPSNPSAPSFDDTFKVGFWQWLGSKKHDRVEWARRRNVAAQTARQSQNTRVNQYVDRKINENRG